MGKGNAAKALDGGVGDAMKKKTGLKPMSAAMRERESDERKVLMRNRIELKRLQSVVDRLRLDLQGFGEDSKKKERQIGKRPIILLSHGHSESFLTIYQHV